MFWLPLALFSVLTVECFHKSAPELKKRLLSALRLITHCGHILSAGNRGNVNTVCTTICVINLFVYCNTDCIAELSLIGYCCFSCPINPSGRLPMTTGSYLDQLSMSCDNWLGTDKLLMSFDNWLVYWSTVSVPSRLVSVAYLKVNRYFKYTSEKLHTLLIITVIVRCEWNCVKTYGPLAVHWSDSDACWLVLF